MSNRRTGTELDTAVLLENSFGSLFAAEARALRVGCLLSRAWPDDGMRLTVLRFYPPPLQANRRLKEVPLSLYTPSDAPTGLFASVSARSTALGGWADSWTT